MHTRRLAAVMGLIFLAIISRFIPHPPNFNAVNAIALFSAFALGGQTIALVIVFATMFLSDLALGLHSQIPFVYLSMGLSVLLGRAKISLWTKVPVASLQFFIIVNFGVWLFDGLYPMTANGLVLCYTAAIPFYANQLIGDLFFSALLFGALFYHENMSFGGKVEKENHCRTQ